jgi:hypothetical protein
VIDPDAITRSIPKTTWKGWLQQKARHYTTAKYYRPKHKFFLGLYFSSQFIFYPLLAASIIFYDWRFALGVFGLRLLVQGWIWYKSMKKMGEQDLWPWFFFLDLWMFFYYLIFAPALVRKPKKAW